MPFNRSHPAFRALFVVSLLGMVAAILFALEATGGCTVSGGPVNVDAACVAAAEADQNGSLITAIASLTLMIGAVGFQIGRTPGQPIGPPIGPHVGPHVGFPAQPQPAQPTVPGQPQPQPQAQSQPQAQPHAYQQQFQQQPPPYPPTTGPTNQPPPRY